MELKTGVCNFCGTGCGHVLQVADGAVQGVVPREQHAVSRGRLCVRGWHMHELLRTAERITKPMIRRNGTLEEVSYGEAISFLLDSFRKSKNPRDEIAFSASPRSSNEEIYLGMKLARAVFKSNNVCIHVESGHRNSLDVLFEGTGVAGMTASIDDIQKTGYILVLGSDITRLNPIVGAEIHLAAQKGAVLVTVGSRRTQIAKLSGQHIQNRPGCIRAVLAAMAKILLEEGLVNESAVQSKAAGYDQFKSIVSGLNAGDLAAAAGVELEAVRKAARGLAAAPSAMAFFSSGVSGLDRETVSWLFNLFLMAGKTGEQCGINPVTGICNLQGGFDMGAAPDLLTGFRKVEEKGVRDSFDKAWGSEIPETPGKALFTLLSEASSLKYLIVVDHDEEVVRFPERMKQLECLVYIGAYENDFTRYAQVVLPIAGYIETEGTYTNTEGRVQFSGKKVEPPEGVLPGWKLYSMIAEKAGNAWKYESSEAVLSEIAALTPAYSGMSHGALKKEISGMRWPKPSGKASFLKMDGGMPDYGDGGEYPVLLMAGKTDHYWLKNNLMKKTFIPRREYNAINLLYPNGFIELNGADAKTLGVRDKWPVKVAARSGAMQLSVRINDDIRPGTAYVPYFISPAIADFFSGHAELVDGEDSIIPVRIEKV